MRYFRLLLFFSAFVIYTKGWGQGSNLNKIFSPNLFNGTVDINIPFYNYSLGEDKYGVSLTYNTKGVPVRELAGNVGLHWNLSTGSGGIQRIIKGLPDELVATPDPLDDTLSPIQLAIYSKYSLYKGRWMVGKETFAEKNDTTIFRDGESDEYIVNLGNKNIKFYLGANGDAYVTPTDNYEIKLTSVDITKPNKGFDIFIRSKLDNVKYYFSIDTKQEKHVPFYFTTEKYVQDAAGPYFLLRNYSFTISWKLDSVVYANGNRIAYTYDKKYYKNSVAIDSSYHSYVYNLAEPINNFLIAPVMSKDSVNYVTKIQYPNNVQVLFEYDTLNVRAEFNTGPFSSNINGLTKLLKIKVQSGANQYVYKFNYTYFFADPRFDEFERLSYTANERDRYKLKLKSISLLNNDEVDEKPMYSFQYNDTIPRRFGGGMDVYGFYNGSQAINISSSSSLYTNSNTRPHNTRFAQYGLLKGISNGIGGNIRFYYGSHNVVNITNPLIPINNDWVGKNQNDGVRIDSILISDSYDNLANNSLIFDYSGGQRFFNGGRFYTILKQPQNVGSGLYHINEFFTTPTQINGSNQGYSTVKVTNKNKYGDILDQRIEEYTNFTDGYSAAKNLVVGGGKSILDYPFANKQYLREWEIGLLKSVKFYDNKLNIISESVNDYYFILDTVTSLNKNILETYRLPNKKNGFIFIQDYIFDVQNGWNNIDSFEIVTDNYRPFTGSALKKHIVQKKYTSNSNFLVDSISYYYDTKNNLKYVITKNSKGRYIEDHFIYNYNIPKNVILSNTYLNETMDLGMQEMVATEKWEKSSNLPAIYDASTFLKEATIYHKVKDRNTFLTKQIFTTATLTPLNYTTYTGQPLNTVATNYINVQNVYNGVPNPNFVEATNINLFDEKGNSIQTYIPLNKVYKSMMWDTISGQKIVEVLNAAHNEIAFANFENNFFKGNMHYVNQSNVVRIPSGNISNPNQPALPIGISKTISGKFAYVLTNNSGVSNKDLFVNELTPNKDYRITFWSSNNAMPTFGIENGTQFVLTKIGTQGSFNQYEAIFRPTVSNQKIGFHATSSIVFDDIRIHPVNASMSSYLYEPLFGLTMETTNTGKIIYYEYDKSGRLSITRDQEGNILSKKEYYNVIPE